MLKKFATIWAALWVALIFPLQATALDSRQVALLSAQTNPYPGATIALDFVGARTNGVPYYGWYGNKLGAFTAIPNLSVARTLTNTSVSYAETVEGTLTPFGANTARITNKGLLVEEARTNTLRQSQALDQSPWSLTNASVSANAIAAPDGTLTADKLVENTANGKHQAGNSDLVGTSGQSVALSLYAKAGERTRIYLELSTAIFGANIVEINLTTGALSGNTSGVSVQQMANGWWRIVAIRTATSTGSGVVYVMLGDGSSNNYTGDGTSGAYIWGVQEEANAAFATSYIPTTSATATRAADNISVGGLSGALAFPWTLFSEALLSSYDDVNQCVVSASDGTTNNRADLRRTSAAAIIGAAVAGGAGQSSAVSGVTLVGEQVARTAMRMSTGAYRVAANGSAGSEVVITNPSGLDRLYMGVIVNSTYLNGYLRRVVLYPYAANDNQLQGMTGTGW